MPYGTFLRVDRTIEWFYLLLVIIPITYKYSLYYYPYDQFVRFSTYRNIRIFTFLRARDPMNLVSIYC